MTQVACIAPDWRPASGVRALYTTRQAGDMADPRVAPAGLPTRPRWLTQVHGIAVADLDLLPEDCGAPVADAAITTLRNVVCVVRTADCLPVLLAAADGSGVGAAHAGWRGLASGVIEATIAALRARIGPEVALQAWLGPAIGPGHFEVGAQVYDTFIEADAGAREAFVPGASDGRWMCDLYALARQRLAALGVTAVAGGGLCTYADEQQFYSHRRDVQHRGLDAAGRMASCIWRT